MAKRQGSFLLPNKKKEYKPGRPDYKNGNEHTKEDFKGGPNRRQEEFDRNRPGVEDVKQSEGKKPFDKKTYRLKKYSKKYKLEQWEEQRKKKLLRNYYKDVKNEPPSGSYKPKTFDEDTTDSASQVGRFVRHPDVIAQQEVKDKSNAKKDAFWKAKEKINKIKEEKQQRHQAAEIAKMEKAKKMEEYKKKKQERFKKLSKKNKKGQPMMTGRMELLLDKIQNKT